EVASIRQKIWDKWAVLSTELRGLSAPDPGCSGPDRVAAYSARAPARCWGRDPVPYPAPAPVRAAFRGHVRAPPLHVFLHPSCLNRILKIRSAPVPAPFVQVPIESGTPLSVVTANPTLAPRRLRSDHDQSTGRKTARLLRSTQA